VCYLQQVGNMRISRCQVWNALCFTVDIEGRILCR
jgi:hypothetical protein